MPHWRASFSPKFHMLSSTGRSRKKQESAVIFQHAISPVDVLGPVRRRRGRRRFGWASWGGPHQTDRGEAITKEPCLGAEGHCGLTRSGKLAIEAEESTDQAGEVADRDGREVGQEARLGGDRDPVILG